MPECTYNPELQYVYHCIAQKAINSDKLLTKQVPEHIQNILRPPKQIMENAQQPINEIKKLFSLTSITVDKYEFMFIYTFLMNLFIYQSICF